MALLGKWGLRFASERDSLWRHVIARKFGEEGGGWTSVVLRKGYGVGFWKAIRKTWEWVMHSSVRLMLLSWSGVQVGNNRRKLEITPINWGPTFFLHWLVITKRPTFKESLQPHPPLEETNTKRHESKIPPSNLESSTKNKGWGSFVSMKNLQTTHPNKTYT
ncbi:hypothetical protein CK203_033243 [Vitis vinifera]|uniref:Uncharacterized protein n=1 Tax=Vitis vinifera TaxID=29760 RepID=A0A438D6E5_VITVI|nr:hypothetical protein CK203_093531 [Vitis vinifera]RVW81969.1 hypothetical protein CK203_033243 [Vitis vinifera]